MPMFLEMSRILFPFIMILLRNGEEPIMLTSLIASQIRLMIHVGSLRKKGYQQHQIAKTLSVHPYRVKLMMENRNLPMKNDLL